MRGNYNEENTEIICPFCGEKGFDKPGLKTHLIHYCEEYNDTESFQPMFK
jgi:hypothetical protein